MSGPISVFLLDYLICKISQCVQTGCCFAFGTELAFMDSALKEKNISLEMM